ncbi:MAG: helix-turn-helix transcriptional regulator [Nitrososphaeraceae archaeon]
MLLLNGYSHPKERRVVELRKEGKSYRQIAEEARISPRDIKPILVKYGVDDISGYSENGRNEDPNSYMSISSRAYKLYSEEMMTPTEVAIAMNIEASEAIRYHDDALQLNNRGILVKLFKELNDKQILWLLHLCAVVRSKKMSISQVIECVSIYDEDLPMIKQLREDANNDLEDVQKQVFQCENRVEYLDYQTEKLAADVKFKRTECKKLDKIRMEIIGQTLRLRGFISEFRDNNLTYIKIEKFVEDTVDRILREGANMKLLEFALISVLKSLPRRDQYEYRYLLHKLDLVEVSGSFDRTNSMSTPTTNTIPRINSDTIVVRNNNSQNTHNLYHHSYLTSKNDHCPACYEKEILAMAKKYFENLKQQITDEVMSALIKEKGYSSSEMVI